MTQNNETKTDKLRVALERGLIDDATYKLELANLSIPTVEEAKEAVKAHWAARDAAANAPEETITIGFKVKESNGETVLSMDEYSETAVTAGYDALRASVIAKANDNATGARAALAIVEAAAPRAAEVGKSLVEKGADLAAKALKPGGKASDRAQLRAVMKGALRAYRVGYGKRK